MAKLHLLVIRAAALAVSAFAFAAIASAPPASGEGGGFAHRAVGGLDASAAILDATASGRLQAGDDDDDSDTELDPDSEGEGARADGEGDGESESADGAGDDPQGARLDGPTLDSAFFGSMLAEVQAGYRQRDIAPMVPYLENPTGAPPAGVFARLADTAYGQFFADALSLLPRFDALPESLAIATFWLDYVGGRKVQAGLVLSFYRPEASGDAEAHRASHGWCLGDFDVTVDAPDLRAFTDSYARVIEDATYTEPDDLTARGARELPRAALRCTDNTNLAGLLRDYVAAVAAGDTAAAQALLWDAPPAAALEALAARWPLIEAAGVLDVLQDFPHELTQLPARVRSLEVALEGVDDEAAWQLKASFRREFDDWYVDVLRVGAGRRLDTPEENRAFDLTPAPD